MSEGDRDNRGINTFSPTLLPYRLDKH